MKELLPFDLLKTWLEEEKNAGAQYAQHAILSTHGQDDCPHARVVSIREINEEQLLFFTQRITRKVEEIKANPHITLTFWLERFAREVIIEGTATFFSQEENEHYWQAYPQWAQIRFCSYAPTSGLPIKSKQCLEDKKLSIEQQYQTSVHNRRVMGTSHRFRRSFRVQRFYSA